MRRRPSSIGGIRASLVLLLLSLLLVGVACARRDQAAVEQQGDADAQRRIHLGLAQPLIDGDARLLSALPGARTRTLAFVLQADGAEVLAAPAAGDAGREDVALFLVLERAEGAAVYLLDPARMRLALLADGTHTIHRSVLVGRTLSDGVLEVFRFGFTVAGAGVAPTVHTRLTMDGGNALPVAVPAADSVVYLHRDDDGGMRLMRLDGAEATPRPLFAEQGFDVRHLRSDGAGVVFAANRDGTWRLYRCDLAGGAMTPWESTTPMGDERAAVVFTLGPDGFAPQVAEVPVELTLPVVAALVAARNPAVLRRRALLAAALVEARQLELANLPSINLGALYTPVVGLFTTPVGFSGDYLAEGVLRGLAGVVQPLFERERNHALSEAGRVRATIARDALAEELNRQQADAALAFIACQALQARLIQSRALLALAERALTVHRHQQDAGRAGSAEHLAIEQEHIARQADVASDERWLRVQLDRLKGCCGLAASCASAPVAQRIPWEDVAVDDYGAVLRTALLNHPHLRAAQGAVREAFFAGQAGSRYRPTLSLGAGYAISGKPGDGLIDDFVSLGLSGNLPLAWFKDRDLQRDYLVQLDAALRAGEEVAALELRRDLADAWATFHHARGTLAGQRAQVRAADERLRIAALRAERGQAGAVVPTVSDLITLERDVLLARREELACWREVAERHVRIVQSQGLADGLWRTVVPAPAAPAAPPPVPPEVQP